MGPKASGTQARVADQKEGYPKRNCWEDEDVGEMKYVLVHGSEYRNESSDPNQYERAVH